MHVTLSWFRHGLGLAVLGVALAAVFITFLMHLPEAAMAPVALLLFGLVQLGLAATRLVRARRAPREDHKN